MRKETKWTTDDGRQFPTEYDCALDELITSVNAYVTALRTNSDKMQTKQAIAAKASQFCRVHDEHQSQ